MVQHPSQISQAKVLPLLMKAAGRVWLPGFLVSFDVWLKSRVSIVSNDRSIVLVCSGFLGTVVQPYSTNLPNVRSQML